MMEDVFLPIAIVGMLFIGVPWIIFHYITQWRKTGSVTVEDEKMMDEMFDLARRLEDRMQTIERIIAADNPEFRPAPSRDREAGPRLEKDRPLRNDDYRRDPRDHDYAARAPRDEDYRRERY